MIVHRDREDALGASLADHIIVEHLADFGRSRDAVASLDQRGLRFFADDVVAQFDAFIADEHRRPGDELPHLVLRFPAERAVKGALAVAASKFRHIRPIRPGREQPFRPC
jgi:hypothetical protein